MSMKYKILGAFLVLLASGIVYVVFMPYQTYDCSDFPVYMYDTDRYPVGKVLTYEEFEELKDEVSRNYENLNQLMLQRAIECRRVIDNRVKDKAN